MSTGAAPTAAATAPSWPGTTTRTARWSWSRTAPSPSSTLRTRSWGHDRDRRAPAAVLPAACHPRGAVVDGRGAVRGVAAPGEGVPRPPAAVRGLLRRLLRQPVQLGAVVRLPRRRQVLHARPAGAGQGQPARGAGHPAGRLDGAVHERARARRADDAE